MLHFISILLSLSLFNSVNYSMGDTENKTKKKQKGKKPKRKTMERERDDDENCVAFWFLMSSPRLVLLYN